MAVRASATASPSSASASAGSLPSLARAASRRLAASATAKAPIALAEPFSVCASAAASAGSVGQRVDQFGGLGREHRQHLALEAGIAKRHALEMLEIDRTVIGSERRRWHPVDPFEMKRHGVSPNLALLHRSGRRAFAQPITKLVNGTFERICRKFASFLAEWTAPIARFPEEF